MAIADNLQQYQDTLTVLQNRWIEFRSVEQAVFVQYPQDPKIGRFHAKFIREITHAENMRKDAVNAITEYLRLYESDSATDEELTGAYEKVSYFQAIVNNAVTPDMDSLWGELRILIAGYGASYDSSL
jgi:hypothetical protein